MKACFSDCVELPGSCAWDEDRVHDCLLAARGVQRADCQYWRPEKAVAIAREILGIGPAEGKKCFGMACKGCKDFFTCEEHFPPGCWE
jgi:hypothetical protein